MRERVADEYGFQRGVVGEVRMFEGEAGQGLQLREAIFFELHRVVIVEIVDADDRMPLGDQAFGKVESDEPGRAGDENVHVDLFWVIDTWEKMPDALSARRERLRYFARKKTVPL